VYFRRMKCENKHKPRSPENKKEKINKTLLTGLHFGNVLLTLKTLSRSLKFSLFCCCVHVMGSEEEPGDVTMQTVYA
jgi:hypothetical protein